MIGADRLARTVLGPALDRVVRLNQAPVDAWIRRVRRADPGATPAQVVATLERQYRRTVMGLGAASGAAAAGPGITTGLGLATAPGEIALFLEATALFAHAVAEIHGVHVDDPERKRTLVLAIALGEPGVRLVEKTAGRKTDWPRHLVRGMPLSGVRDLNAALGERFLTRYSRKQGLLVLGRAVPLGVGAAVGAAGNAALAQASVSAARRAFGPAPKAFPPGLGSRRGRVVDGEVVEGRAADG